MSLLVRCSVLTSFFLSLMLRRPPRSTLFPYTTLFRSHRLTPSEVRGIEDMVTSPEYRHVPTGTLAVLAQRLGTVWARSEEHTSELQSLTNLVCRLLLEKKKKKNQKKQTKTITRQHTTE